MKKVNLKEFDVFTDISKRQRVRCDMRRSVANLLYNQMHGIEALNLALRSTAAKVSCRFRTTTCACFRRLSSASERPH